MQPEQDQALADLVVRGRLTAEQADEVRYALFPTGIATAPAGPNPAAVVLEVAGYIGGGLMLAGITVFLEASRNRFTKTEEAMITGGIAVLLLVAGFLAARGLRGVDQLRRERTAPRRRLVAVVWAIASIPAAYTAGLVVTDSHQARLFAAGVGLVVAAGGYATIPAVPGQLATAAFTAFGLSQFLDWTALLDAKGVSAGYLGLGALWAIFALMKLTPPRAGGLAIGAAFAIFAGQVALGTHPKANGYVITLIIAAACFLIYWSERATIVLAMGVIASTLGLTETIYDVTNGALSASTTLLIGGGVLVLASVFGIQLRGARIATEAVAKEGIAGDPT
jgi:hypothetical protein